MTEELQELGVNVGQRRVGRFLLGDVKITCQAMDARERHQDHQDSEIQASRAPEGCPASQWATTDSNHAFNIAPNLLDQDFSATGPNQKWAGDISYIWTSEGWLYLAVILDLYSRRVIGPLSVILKKSPAGQWVR